MNKMVVVLRLRNGRLGLRLEVILKVMRVCWIRNLDDAMAYAISAILPLYMP